MRLRTLATQMAALLILLPVTAAAQRFYPDDPLMEELPPISVEQAGYRSLNSLYEYFTNTFSSPGERHPATGVIPAQGVNTLGEVPDGPWFVNRHALKRLTSEELVRGPGDQDPPNLKNPLQVLTVKKYDVRPGLLVHDADNTLYLIRFDPLDRLEMSTGAGMIGARLFHAMGYWVPESYLVYFERSQLVASPDGEEIDDVGEPRPLNEEDIDVFLENMPRDPAKGYRALAIKSPQGAKLLGPYQYYGTRSDDPNDLAAHEHRRDLRGLHMFSAWVGNNWIEATQSQDALLEENDVYFIRHYLVDFFTHLGSGFEQAKNAREGNEPLFDLNQTVANLFGFGMIAPKWQRAKYPKIKSLGLFEYTAFDPSKWLPNYPAAALANHLPDDDYWAAKQVMAFTDEDIRAIVKTAQYSDPEAGEWIVRCLIERRNKIGRYAFDLVLPLDNFRLEGNELKYDDLAVHYGFRQARDYSVKWSEFNNQTEEHQSIFSEGAWEIPDRARGAEAGSYYAAEISAGETGKTVTVYVRKEKEGYQIAGIDRSWPNKRLAADTAPAGITLARYPELTERQRELIDSYVANYNKKTGFNLTPEEGYNLLTISERTTFEGVTHALSQSELTDENGKSLGIALDLLTGIDRIAGQYYGRQGDEQFRLYVNLREDTRDILEKSQEFHFGHENTVYHMGYPHSYRQGGKYPNMQFSTSDDGLRADIDVDYRSSKPPAALWNGHLTSANSDIRAGDNHERHSNRWSGLAAWWQELFGDLPEGEGEENDLLAKEAPEPVTPLPPDRPVGADIAEVQDAIQEFMTDWLVRRDYDEALSFLSDRGLGCVRLDDDTQSQSLTAGQVRSVLRDNMQAFSEEVGEFENLTEAINPVIPWREALQIVEQPYSGEFSLARAPDVMLDVFACHDQADESISRALDDPNPKYGNVYATIFRFKVENSRGGTLGMLWTQEEGAWKAVSWKIYEQ